MKGKIKTIPTLIALTLLLAGIAGGVLFIQQAPGWLLRASPEATPKQIKTTNVTGGSFSVSWITEGEVSGFLKYGTDGSLSLPYLMIAISFLVKLAHFQPIMSPLKDLNLLLTTSSKSAPVEVLLTITASLTLSLPAPN